MFITAALFSVLTSCGTTTFYPMATGHCDIQSETKLNASDAQLGLSPREVVDFINEEWSELEMEFSTSYGPGRKELWTEDYRLKLASAGEATVQDRVPLSGGSCIPGVFGVMPVSLTIEGETLSSDSPMTGILHWNGVTMENTWLLVEGTVVPNEHLLAEAARELAYQATKENSEEYWLECLNTPPEQLEYAIGRHLRGANPLSEPGFAIWSSVSCFSFGIAVQTR